MLNLNSLKKLYNNSPLWIKNLYASIPYDIRNGKEYRKWNTFLEKDINREEYQLLKLKETILYAYENTDYYKRIFTELHCHPSEINHLKDIEKLPFIDKDIVLKNYDDIRVKNYPKKNSFFAITGGSTGQPMKFLQSKNVWGKEVAFINNYFKASGYAPHHSKALFRGGDFKNLKNNQFWKLDPINNATLFSLFHLNANTVSAYVDELNRTKIKFFHVYPSGIISLIDNMKNQNLKLNYQVKSIFLTSENFTIKDIKYIENYFNCTVSSFFGHSERLIFAPLDSTQHNKYQLNDKYGLAELIDGSGVTISDNNIKGELVGTSFDNYAMPLIRYRTGDRTSYNDKTKQILNLIEGRWDNEYLNGKNGVQLNITALYMEDILINCMNFQFIQKESAKAELLVVPKKSFSDNDKKNILEALNKKAEYSIEFTIKTVPSLILTERGKMKTLIKEI